MLRYAITPDLAAMDSAQRRRVLTAFAERRAQEEVDFVQLRAKSLEAGELSALGRAMLARLDGTRTRLLVNGRCDVAAAIDAAGVHLTGTAEELRPRQVREVFAAAGCAAPVVSVSCHALTDVWRARDDSADLILFGPVFEKALAGETIVAGVGLERLREACAAAAPVPVLALGGVTWADAARCLEAGAQGVAAIRLFG